MPCPEKFRDSLIEFNVDDKTAASILEGYENLKSSSPKVKKAAFFKRSVDIMDKELGQSKTQEILEWNACCKSGARLKASKEFARINKDLSLQEKLAKIAKAPYMNMGSPVLEEDGTITINAVSYVYEGRFMCACSNFRRVPRDYPVSKHYCYCCGGHFRFHYEIMLNTKLEILEVTSSPLDSDGAKPCVFRARLIESEA